jgi:hypothetical protein
VAVTREDALPQKALYRNSAWFIILDFCASAVIHTNLALGPKGRFHSRAAKTREDRMTSRRILMGLLGSGALMASFGAVDSAGAVGIYNLGDVMASVDGKGGEVTRYDNNLVLRPAPNPLITSQGPNSLITTGSAFDNTGNFYVTDFNSRVNSGVTKFDVTGAVVGPNPFFAGGIAYESILFDAAGNAWVGDAGSNKISEFAGAAPSLLPTTTFPVTTDNPRHGTDWIDLAANQTTFFYTSEGTHVNRFDTILGQLTALNSVALPGTSAYELRIIPATTKTAFAGDVLVADSSSIILLSATGAVLKTYTDPIGTGKNVQWFAASLDPNGLSFWSGDLSNGELAEFDLTSGALENSTFTCGGGCLAGVSVVGEQTSSQVPEPASLAVLITSLLGFGLLHRCRPARPAGAGALLPCARFHKS